VNSDNKKLLELVKKNAWNHVPGLYASLEFLCMREAGMDCLATLLEKPGVLRDILCKLYCDEYSLKFIVQHVFLKPVLSSIGVQGKEEELTDVFVNNPNEFRNKLATILKSIQNK